MQRRRHDARNVGLLGLAALVATCGTTVPVVTGDSGSAPPDAGPTTDTAAAPQVVTRRLYVFDTVTFTRVQKDGKARGFDVDGKVTPDGDAATCGKSDFTAPDGQPGIDNQFALLVPVIEKSGLQAFEGLLQASIDNGGVLLMLQVDGLDSFVDDADVKVTLRAGQGMPLLGTDKKLLSGQTFHLRADSPEKVAAPAAVKGGQLDAGPFDVDVPVSVFGNLYVLEVRAARVRARLVDERRIEAGLFGGGITFSSIQKIALTGAKDQPSIIEMVTTLVDGMGDLAPDAKGNCTQISAALAFSGVSAFLYAAERQGKANPKQAP